MSCESVWDRGTCKLCRVGRRRMVALGLLESCLFKMRKPHAYALRA